MPTIDLVYFDAGGGHRAAALALQAVLAERRSSWQVRLVHLARVLDSEDRFRRLTGLAPEDIYNRPLARGWTLGFGPALRVLQALIRVANPLMIEVLRRHWLETRPDLVVSLVPNFNRALYASLAAALPGAPFVTVLTDLADLPPRFWIERAQDQYLVCGSERAVTQAREAGHADDRIFQTSGMILRPDFYRPWDGDAQFDRRDQRAQLGLDPSRPTGVVMFGGQGSREMLRIAEALDDVQLILICGHNTALVTALEGLRRSAPHAVLGFTSQVQRYLRLGDFFVGKPGPGSLSEALHLGLPVLTYRNAWTLPQERYNTQWVQEHGLGRVVRSTRQLRAAAQSLLADLEAYRARVGRIENRAVFELPDILSGILDTEATQTCPDLVLARIPPEKPPGSRPVPAPGSRLPGPARSAGPARRSARPSPRSPGA